MPVASRMATRAYGSLRLKAVWGPAMLTNLPADRQTIGVSTFAGQLRMATRATSR